MPEYLFDAKLVAAFRVNANTLAQAKAKLEAALDCADANLGMLDGNPLLAEISLESDGNAEPCLTCAEIDGEEPTICPDCDAVEGEPEWGTVGDGYDGYCPSCADAREAKGVYS